ncbi:MAG: isocitrate/isopropylmalate family dehydrogenase [Candidatus Absconditabacterales bacterium]
MKNYITMGPDQKLIVPDNPIIGVLEGDGIGKEIVGEMMRLVDAGVKSEYDDSKKINREQLLIGEDAYAQTGSHLPESTITELKRMLVGIKGPTNTPLGGGHASVNVGLRKELDLGVCWRPVKYFPGVKSPVVHPENVAIDIFRENVEGSYVGVEFDQSETQVLFDRLAATYPEKLSRVAFQKNVVVGLDFASEYASKRIMRAGLEFAIKNKKRSVTITSKPNIKKIVDGNFQKRCLQVCHEEFQDYCYSAEEAKMIWEEYARIKKVEGWLEAEKFRKSKFIDIGKIEVQTLITDNFFQQILLRPEDYDAVVAQNLNGDYISDALAAQVGGIGIAPGGNINYQTGHAVFEATHGTAPLIYGKWLANPTSIDLSAVMLLNYIERTKAAQAITTSIEKTLANGQRTGDLGGSLGTREYTDALIANLQ